LAGDLLGAGGDLVIEVVRPPLGLRLELLLRRDQAPVPA
jgi:hypothetical protein